MKKKSAKKESKPAATKKAAKKAVQIKRRPRARRLPGMENAGIEELETLAEDMSDVIAQKKELMASEKSLNESLVEAMKRHGKTVYSHRGIHINLSATEKAKVVIKEVDDTPAEDAPAPRVGEESLAVSG
jgi:hypothetical protein